MVGHGHGYGSIVTCIVGGLKSCVLCSLRQLKVLGYFTFIILSFSLPPLLVAAQPCLANAPPNTAAPTPASHPIVGSMHGPSSCAARSLQPSTDSGSEEEEPTAERLTCTCTCTRRARRQDRQELGRTTEPTIHSTEDERFSPPSKENQTTAAFGRVTRRPPGRTVPNWSHKNPFLGTKAMFNRPTSRPSSTFFMTCIKHSIRADGMYFKKGVTTRTRHAKVSGMIFQIWLQH